MSGGRVNQTRKMRELKDGKDRTEKKMGQEKRNGNGEEVGGKEMAQCAAVELPSI